MKAFLRSVELSLKYKWPIFGALSCSLLIALLWSASISTVFPIVKIVLEGETAQSWIENEIAKGQQQTEKLKLEIAEIQSQIPQLQGSEKITLANKSDLLANRLEAEVDAVARYQFFQPFVDKYLPKSAFQTLVITMVWLLGMAILKGILLVVCTMLVSHVANRTVMDLRRIYYRKALELDQHRLDRLGTSNMMTHLSHNMLMVSAGLRMFYGKMIREPLKLVICLAIAAYISLPLLLLSCFVVPAGAFLITSLSRRMKNSTQREMQGMADVFDTLMETFRSIKTVRIFNRESTERRRFKENSATLYRMSLRIAVYDSLLRPVSEVLGILSIAISVLAGAYLVLNQATHIWHFQICNKPIEPSTFVLFYTMLAGATDPARKMSEIVNVLVRGGTACENLFKAFDVPSQMNVTDNTRRIPLHEESIQFENVVFGYIPRQPVLKNVTLKVPFGQAIAIVGGNGSGKSTLMNLLARFYDPNRGSILIDGQNLTEVQPKKVRRQIAWVTQDSTLFCGSVRDNIAYGKMDATEEEIMSAAKMATVDRFVDQLKDGFDTEVGESGRNLSAGQRQRVALARAIVADPRILILDEATSQMDGQTESIVHQSLKTFLSERTCFIITHRASSLCLAERVVVMEHGRVIHDGPVETAYNQSSEFQFLFEKKSA